MHGPVRGEDGAYYLALNLVHDGGGSAYTGGGTVMGTWGGFNGWAVRVEPNGKFQLFANGLRSPASVGASPDGRVWYTDNQGDFVGTSKLFELKKDKFYGHPAGLVDLPGMTPDSPEIKYDKVADRREHAVVMFPHNRVANSPGNPAWVTQKKFGPFAGQMLIGDQTQSNLLRVVAAEGRRRGAGQRHAVLRRTRVRCHAAGVPAATAVSLLGQTGRGWQAKGGKIASLQHVRWDGKTVAPQIVGMSATPEGFRLRFHAAARRRRERGHPANGAVDRVVDVSRCAGLRLARARSAWRRRHGARRSARTASPSTSRSRPRS